jgi:DNA (cytosine-5)-methyltransferase 1
MRVAGLFAGIAGLELGLMQSGHETVLLSEIMPAAKAVLKQRLPNIEVQDDIRDLRSLPDGIELVTGGFPCQDLSQAGLAQGLEGTRSSLVGEVFRLARSARPSWILLENVPFMLQLKRGAAIRTIIEALEELGYLWAWRVVDTFGFGLPQRRERVYLLASREHDPADVLMADDALLSRPATSIGRLAHGFYWTEGRGGLGWAVDSVPTLKNGSTIGIPSPPAVLMPNGHIIKPDIRDAERLQGFPVDWTSAAADVGRASSRWALVGNAVSVPVARWLGSRLAVPGIYDRTRDASFPNEGTLPKAARFDGTRRHRVHISVDPLGVRPLHLSNFLHHEGQPLSAKATSGFLSRTRVATLKFAPGFIEAVEAHLKAVTGEADLRRKVA